MSKTTKPGDLPRRGPADEISRDGLFSASEEERSYRAQRVFTRALAVLEDDAAARAWMKRSNRSLGGKPPLALLDTEVGYELVLDTLSRIEYGIIS